MSFFRHAICKWTEEYLKHIFQRRRPLASYPTGQTGIYRLPNNLLVAIASEWGTGTTSALSWLDQVIFRDPADRRPVILLSHHQWFSAFDDHDYPVIGEQLRPYLNRVALWFWGHEHRFAGYAAFAPKGIKVRARCIGHGGMPIELGWKRKKMAAPVFSDQRLAGTLLDGTKIGYCGFALLEFRAEGVVITYIDEEGKPLVRETWTKQDRTLHGSAEVLHKSPGFEVYRPIEDLAL